MLFCFSSQQQKEEEHVYLVNEADELEVEESEEAHENHINEDLLVNSGKGAVLKKVESATKIRRSNHRRTEPTSGLFLDTHSGPLKGTVAGGRSFRKSASSVSLGATSSAAAQLVATAAANGKFVDPSVAAVAAVAAAVAADEEHFGSQEQQTQSPNGTSISRTLSKIGPFLRRNRSSKGTEHLQREALRKSNETAAGLGVDQSQRYIKLPTSSSAALASSSSALSCDSTAASGKWSSSLSSTSTSSRWSAQKSAKHCSTLSKSSTSVAIVTSGECEQSSLTSCELSLASGLLSACRSDPTTHRVLHREGHHSPASASSSSTLSSGSSTYSPPPPTLVPRSANNPPPRPKTSKPSRCSSSASINTTTTTATTNNNTSSLPARPLLSPTSGSVGDSVESIDELLGLSETPSCSQSTSTDTPCVMTSTVTSATMSLLTCTTSTTPTSSSSSVSQCTGSANGAASSGSTSGQQSTQQSQQQQSSSTSSNSSSSSNHHHHQHQQFINKPPRGWLHPDHKLSDSVGVTYAVRVSCTLH